MKNSHTLKLFLIINLFILVSLNAYAGNGKINQRLTIGAKWHMAHSAFEKLPYDDGDIGYMMAYELHEGIGMWQLGVDYTSDPGNNKDATHVLTPQMNLIFKDRIYRAGAGILKSFINQDKEEDTDTDFYYQFLLGLDFPVSKRFSIGANGHYAFEKWKLLKDFKPGDIEYSAFLSFQF